MKLFNFIRERNMNVSLPPFSISEMLYLTNLNILMTHHNCKSHKTHDKWIEDTKNDFCSNEVYVMRLRIYSFWMKERIERDWTWSGIMEMLLR